MGNKASKQDQGPAVAQYLPPYEVIRPIDDPNYGKVKLVKDTKSNRQMILKEFVFDTKEKYEEELKFFKARAAHEHPNIVHFIGYNSKDSSNLCSTFYKVSVFLEILITDLQSDFKERIRTLHNYTENDILLIAENISSALAYMQTHNLSHGDVRPLNIFVSGDGKSYKLTDPKLEADRNSNGLIKAIFQSAHPLLAPELASIVPTGEFAHNANPYQADIFSLGATLLQLATMKNSEDLYDYKKGTISQRLLDERLRQVHQSYSELTFALIRDMLSIQPNQRPTAVQIQQAVAPYKQDIVHQHSIKLEKHASFGPIDSTPKNELVEKTKRSGFPIQLASLKNRNLEEDSYSQGARTDRSNPSGFPRNLGDFDHQYQSARSHNPHNHDASLFKVREPSNTEHLELEQSATSPEFTSDLDRKVYAALQRTQKTYSQVQSITSKAGSDKKKTADLNNIPPFRSTEQVSSKYGSSYLAYQPSGNLYITIEPPPVDVKTQNPFRSDLPRAEERAKRSAIPVIPEIPEVHSQFEGTTFTNEYVIPRTGYYVAEFQNSDKNGEIQREPFMLPPHQGFGSERQSQTVEYTSAIPETHHIDPEINEVVAQIIAEQREYEFRSSQIEGQKLLDSTVRSFQAPATDSFHYAYDSNQPQPQYSSFQYQTVSQDFQRDIPNANFETRPANTGEKIKRSALASASKKYNQPEELPPSYRSQQVTDIPVISYNIGGGQGQGQGQGQGTENYLSNRNFSPEHSNSRDVIVNEGRNTAQDYSFYQKYSTAEPQTRTTPTGYPSYSQETKSIGPFGGTIVYETHGRRPQEYSSNGGLLADVSSASSKYTTTTLGHGRFEGSGDLRKYI